MPPHDESGSSREARRLDALARAHILDTPAEREYDDLVKLASQVCGTPIALVSLVTADRQWFKAKIGLEADETGRDVAFCARAIERPEQTLQVDDALLDPRFADNPLVVGEPRIRFYAGAPIVTRSGEALGTVCVIDTKPRHLERAQVECLEALARHASTLIDLRKTVTVAAREESKAHALLGRLEGQVEERTQERDRLWELSDDLLVTSTYDGRLLRVSPSWTRLLGYSQETLNRTPVGEISHPDDAASVSEALRQARRTGATVSFDDRLRDVHGAWHVIAWTLTPEPGGERLTGVGRDVTRMREDQAALAIAEGTLRQSQKMDAVGQLTGGIAHDFNNLLTGISGSLELLQIRVAQGRFDEIERYVDTAQNGAKRAAALTHRLLAFARRQTLEAKATDVNRLVQGMEEMVRRSVGPHNDVEVVTAPGLWTTMIDRNQLENAVLNLCINARDAMPDGGRMTIETANFRFDASEARARELPPGDYIAVSVSDTGSGMPPDVIKRAFDPFFTTKPLGAGTGLGLSMVYGFARQSNGQVRLYSEVGHGTSVRLYLPRHLGPSDLAEAEHPSLIEPIVEHDETILIVDDEPTVRMLIAEVLSDMGYASIEAEDGAAGLRVVESGAQIDLLITDVGLPGGINGRQLADAARALRPSLKVLFVTGYAENSVLGSVKLGDGMQVLTKPFSVETLAQRVRDLAIATAH